MELKYLLKIKNQKMDKFLICGGGRKNKYLIESIQNNFKKIF